MKFWLNAVGIVAAVTVTACSSFDMTSSEKMSKSPRISKLRVAQDYIHLAATTTSLAYRGAEYVMLKIETEVPGFGGFYVDTERNSIVAYLKDTLNAEALREVLLARLNGDLETVKLSVSGLPTVEVVQGEYTFSELVTWKDWLSLAGGEYSVLVDADEFLNRLRVEVLTEAAKTSILNRLEGVGIPRNAVVISVVSEMSQFTANLRGRVDTTLGGVLIQAWPDPVGIGCSLGFNLRGGFVQEFPADRYLYTAAHCYNLDAGTTGVTGYRVGQPTVGTFASAGDTIATVVYSPPWTSTDPLCYGTPLCTTVDLIIAEYNTGRPAALGVAIPNGTAPYTITGVQSIMSFNYPYVGVPVTKVGKTTGRTVGTVTSTCTSVSFPGSRVTCADHATNTVDHGDSGGPVYNTNNPYGPGRLGVGLTIGMTNNGRLIFANSGVMIAFSFFLPPT